MHFQQMGFKGFLALFAKCTSFILFNYWQFQAIHCSILIKLIESYIDIERKIGFCDSFSTHISKPKKKKMIANKITLEIDTAHD